MSDQTRSPHPYDTPLSSGLRSLAEIIGWVACTWLAGRVSFLLAVLVLVVLLGLPTLFSTPGDKKQTIVATPGPVRVVLELGLFGAAVLCVWLLWPAWLAIISTLVVMAAIAFGIPRYKWLLQGAPG